MLHQHNWVVIGVHEERYRPPYSYTLGLTDYELPELVITGLPDKQASEMLIRAAWDVLAGEALAPGKQIRTDGGVLAEVVEVAEPEAHLDAADGLYGQQLAALQLVYTDQHGNWPWDRRFRDGQGGQPVLGVRAKQTA